jgi:hypothetical protein
MFEEFEDGIDAAFGGTIAGFVLSVVFAVGKMLAPSYSSLFALIEVLNLLGTILFVTKMKYLGSGYLLGYLIGFGLSAAFNFEEPWVFLLYAFVGIPLIFIRFTERVQDYLDEF